jgi:hypothetical protein
MKSSWPPPMSKSAVIDVGVVNIPAKARQLKFRQVMVKSKLER